MARKHHTLLLIAGGLGVLYLMSKSGAAAGASGGAGMGTGYGAGGTGYGAGSPQQGGLIQSLFNQFGGGGSPYTGLQNILPVNYAGSPMGSPMGSPYGTAPGTMGTA